MPPSDSRLFTVVLASLTLEECCVCAQVNCYLSFVAGMEIEWVAGGAAEVWALRSVNLVPNLNYH